MRSAWSVLSAQETANCELQKKLLPGNASPEVILSASSLESEFVLFLFSAISCLLLSLGEGAIGNSKNHLISSVSIFVL